MGVRLESSRSHGPPPHAGVEETCSVVGDGLRRMFDDVVAAPMPSSLIELCDALEDAFNRGVLPTGACKTSA